MKEYRQNADWCEDDHPRDSDGKFTGKQAKFDTQQADRERLTSKFKKTDAQPIKSVPYNALTLSEWRRYYDKLGEIQHGDKVLVTDNGDYIFVIGNKLIVSTNDYVKPICRFVMKFENAQKAVDFLTILEGMYD